MNKADNGEGDHFMKRSLQRAILSFYEQGLNTDVTIQVRCKGVLRHCFKVHRLILAMRSSVFADEFHRDFSQYTFVVEGIHPRVMSGLLEYIYSDCLTTDNAEEVINVSKVADYYQISGLKTTCKDVLSRFMVDENNVCSLLNAATYFELESLRDKCMAVIHSRSNTILTSPRFLKASQESISIIFNSNIELSIKERMEAMFSWLQHNKRADRSIISLFDMASLSPDEFLDLMEKFPLFLTPKEAVSILSNMLRPGMMPLPSWYTPYDQSMPSQEHQVSAAMAADKSVRVETSCNKSFSKSTFFGSDYFNGSMEMKLKLTENLTKETRLVMLELAFGSNFVPEDCLEIDLLGYVQSFTDIKERKVKFFLTATPDNYYLVLKENFQLMRKYPLFITLTIKAKGLHHWGTNGPVSNEIYRVLQIPESIPYRICLNIVENQSVFLKTLSDWLVLYDSTSGSKHFLLSSLYFD